MFGFLGLAPDVVQKLKGKLAEQSSEYPPNILLTQVHTVQYHIYMAANSRVSIAGLNDGNVDYVGRSIAACLKSN